MSFFFAFFSSNSKLKHPLDIPYVHYLAFLPLPIPIPETGNLEELIRILIDLGLLSEVMLLYLSALLAVLAYLGIMKYKRFKNEIHLVPARAIKKKDIFFL